MILHAAEFFVIPPCGGGVGGEAVALLRAENTANGKLQRNRKPHSQRLPLPKSISSAPVRMLGRYRFTSAPGRCATSLCAAVTHSSSFLWLTKRRQRARMIASRLTKAVCASMTTLTIARIRLPVATGVTRE